MRVIKRSSRFKTSFKRIVKSNSFDREVFEYVIISLASDIPLPSHYKDHQLQGKYKKLRECHISPDVLLIYEKDEDYLLLTIIDIGTHSEMF